MAFIKPTAAALSNPKNNELGDQPPIGPPRITLKLTPAAQEKQQAQADFISNLIIGVYPELGLIPRVSALITSQHPTTVAQKVALGARLDPKYEATNFDAWYQVLFEPKDGISIKEDEAPGFFIPNEILGLIQKLHGVADIESAHALRPGPPPVHPGTDPLSVYEGFLNAAPTGIDARYAWGFPGGDGTGVNVIDVEQGWDLNHEDLVSLLAAPLPRIKKFS